MSGKKKKTQEGVIVQNRKARHNFLIEETIEAGIVLVGSEVKSLRIGAVNITDAYADVEDGEIYLYNLHISEYKGANQFNHSPGRRRKLLLHKREIKRLFGKVKVKGMTLVPLSLFFNKKNMIKVELAIARGKKLHDKREAEKTKDWNRQKERVLKDQ